MDERFGGFVKRTITGAKVMGNTVSESFLHPRSTSTITTDVEKGTVSVQREKGQTEGQLPLRLVPRVAGLILTDTLRHPLTESTIVYDVGNDDLKVVQGSE